jgi:hypothetical protein
MTILKPAPHVSAESLMWHRETAEFIGEISDIGGRFGRVYNDACDDGLTLVSRYDGREITFVVEHEERDRDGEVQWWVLKPADLALRLRTPFTVKIFND